MPAPRYLDVGSLFDQNRKKLQSALPTETYNQLASSIDSGSLWSPQPVLEAPAPPPPGPGPVPIPPSPGPVPAPPPPSDKPPPPVEVPPQPGPPPGPPPPEPPPWERTPLPVPPQPGLGQVGIGQGFLTEFGGSSLPQLWAELPNMLVSSGGGLPGSITGGWQGWFQDASNFTPEGAAFLQNNNWQDTSDMVWFITNLLENQMISPQGLTNIFSMLRGAGMPVYTQPPPWLPPNVPVPLPELPESE